MVTICYTDKTRQYSWSLKTWGTRVSLYYRSPKANFKGKIPTHIFQGSISPKSIKGGLIKKLPQNIDMQ